MTKEMSELHHSVVTVISPPFPHCGHFFAGRTIPRCGEKSFGLNLPDKGSLDSFQMYRNVSASNDNRMKGFLEAKLDFIT